MFKNILKRFAAFLTVICILPQYAVFAENTDNAFFDSAGFFYKNSGSDGDTLVYMYGGECIFSTLHNSESPCGGYSAKFVYDGHNKLAQIKNKSSSFDLSDIYNDAYLSFYIYVDTASTDNHGLGMYFADGNRPIGYSGKAYLPYDLKYNSWQKVEFKLSDFAKGTADWENINCIEFTKSAVSNKKFVILVQGIEFTVPHIRNIAAENNAGGIRITWNANAGEKYSVLRNGTIIGENIADSEFTDVSPEYGKNNTYRICSVKDGKTVGWSDETSVVAFDTRLENGTAVFCVDSHEAYVNGARRDIDYFDDNVTPYRENGVTYLPVDFCLDARGHVGDYDGGKPINGILYDTAENIAEFLGCHVSENGGIAVLSDSENLPDYFYEEYKNRLEFSWSNVKLGPWGYVTGMLVHPKNSDVRYVRTDVGGVYRWDAAHDEWRWLMEDFGTEDNDLQNIRAFALDPNNENIIYVSAGTDGGKSALLKSFDKGENWIKLDFSGTLDITGHTRLSGESLLVDPNNSDIVYCGTRYEGLWRSTDGGKSFSRIASVPYDSTAEGGVLSLACDGSTVYAGVNGKGVYISTDGGKTFSAIAGGPTVPYRMQITDGVLYVGGDSPNGCEKYGLFKYQNGDWTDISPTSKSGICGFAVKESDTDIIIAQGSPYRNHHIYLSTDGGKTWTDKGETAGDGCVIVFDPDKENAVYVPYGAGIYYIDNILAQKYSAVKRDKGIEEICVNEIVSVPDENAPELFTSCMDKGLMVNETADAYASQASPVAYTGSGVDYCGLSPKFMVKSGWLGFPNTWNLKGNLCVSSDFGRTWKKTTWDNSVLVFDCAVGGSLQKNGYPVIVIVAGTENDLALYRSTDFGETWTKIDGVQTGITSTWYVQNQLLTSDKTDGNTFYYNLNGNFYASSDGGVTWTVKSVLPSLYGTVTKSMPGKEGEVWTICGDGLYRSGDRGEKWEKIVSGCSAFDFGAGIGDVPALYVKGTLGGKFGVYISDDLGKTFRLMSYTSEAAFKSMDICGDKKNYGTVYIGTSGHGVYRAETVFKKYDKKIPLSAEQGDGNRAELKWDFDGAYAYFSVKCDGTEISRTTAGKYTYIPEKLDGKHAFSVAAYDITGNLLAESDTCELTLQDRMLTEKISIYGSGTNCTQINGETEISSYPSAPFGGNAVKLYYSSGYSWEYRTVQNDGVYDISDYIDDGYLSFYMYIDTEDEKYDLALELWNSSWNKLNGGNAGFSFDSSCAINNWAEIRIKLSDIITNTSAAQNIKQIKFIKKGGTTSNSCVYLQNIGISSPETGFTAARFSASETDDGYTLTAFAVNGTDKCKCANIIKAYYENGKLTSTEFLDTISLEANSSAERSYKISKENVKLFFWDKENPLMPLAESLTLTE